MKNQVNSKTKKKSQMSAVWHRFKKNKTAMIGLFLFLTIVIACLSVGIFVDYDKCIAQNMPERLQSPNSSHILGTDEYGRDMLLRILFGGRISIAVGIGAVLISFTGGTIIGSLAAYYGGWVDNVLMRIMDVFLAIPHMLLAIVIVSVLGSSMFNLLLSMSLASIPRFTRIVRASVMSVRGQEFIEAAKACGTRDFRIITKHILPNAIGPMIVQASLNVANSIITVSSMSFIGLGISPPTPEWGTILSAGRSEMRHNPYLVLVPGLAIMLTVMALNMIGDGLRDALDPKLKN